MTVARQVTVFLVVNMKLINLMFCAVVISFLGVLKNKGLLQVHAMRVC